MIYKLDEEVFSLVRAFEERTLPKAEWTHAAHLTVGLFYLLNNSFGAAKNLMSDGIYWLNDAHGVLNTETSGYHETLTVFWLTTVADFLESGGREKSPAHAANELIARCGNPKLPVEFYSRELLFSAQARAHYVAPDLRKFSTVSREPAFSI